MIETKQKFWLPTAKVKELMAEFNVSEPVVRNALNQKANGKFARYIVKRAIEMGAKKQTITIETEE